MHIYKKPNHNLQVNGEKIGERILKLLRLISKAAVTYDNTEADTSARFKRHAGLERVQSGVVLAQLELSDRQITRQLHPHPSVLIRHLRTSL